MPKFIVKNTTIMHNKKTYCIGKEIELTDDESKKLADYVTPVVKTIEISTESTTATTKSAKTSKKADKVASETTTPAVDEVTTDEKKEDINGSETIQTATN